MHLIWGGFNAVMMAIFVPFFIGIAALAASDPKAPTGIMAFFGLFGLFMLGLALLFGLPPILAGYAMLKRRVGRSRGDNRRMPHGDEHALRHRAHGLHALVPLRARGR